MSEAWQMLERILQRRVCRVPVQAADKYLKSINHSDIHARVIYHHLELVIATLVLSHLRG